MREQSVLETKASCSLQDWDTVPSEERDGMSFYLTFARDGLFLYLERMLRCQIGACPGVPFCSFMPCFVFASEPLSQPGNRFR
jgi:hypothetical protein